MNILTKKISFKNEYIVFDDITEEEYDSYISITEFIKKLEREIVPNCIIEEVKLESCLLDGEILQYIYNEFLNKEPSVKNNVKIIDLSWNSICYGKECYPILLDLLKFPQLKFLKLISTGIHNNIENFNEYIPEESKYLLKKIIFLSYATIRYKIKDELVIYDKLLPHDWKEKHEEFYGITEDEKEITNTIDEIQLKGIDLFIKKKNAITLDPLFDMNVLSIIKIIIENYNHAEKINVSLVKKEMWTKDSLKVIIISIGLLTNNFVSMYDNLTDGFEGGNLWNDVKFLYHYFLNDSNSLSYDEAKKIMESTTIQKIIYEKQVYRENHLLDLYPFISQKRDQYLLKKAILCIEKARSINYDKVHHQSALLRYLVIIGEAFKNISLCKEVLPLSLLINISEIISNYKDFYFEINFSEKFFDIFTELKIIKNILKKDKNSSVIQLPSLEDFYKTLQSNNIDHLSLEIKVKREINALKEIFNIEGKEALEDSFPEKDTDVSYDVLQRRKILINNLVIEPERIDAALYHHIKIYSLLEDSKNSLKEYNKFGEFIRWSQKMLDDSQFTPSILIRYTHILLYDIIPINK